jgi:hypothetical protein
VTFLYHFSEDPDIRRFTPHVPETNPDQAPSVWAIDAEHAPLYWFPRDCPRGTVWANDPSQRERLRELFLTDAERLHVTEFAWLPRIRAARLCVYRFDAAPFTPWPEAEGQWVSHEPVVPLDVKPVGDLLDRHREAEIEMRFARSIRPFWEAVVSSGLPFSGVRLRNASQSG